MLGWAATLIGLGNRSPELHAGARSMGCASHLWDLQELEGELLSNYESASLCSTAAQSTILNNNKPDAGGLIFAAQ